MLTWEADTTTAQLDTSNDGIMQGRSTDGEHQTFTQPALQHVKATVPHAQAPAPRRGRRRPPAVQHRAPGPRG